MKILSSCILCALLSGCDFSAGPDGAWWVGNPEKGVYVFIEDNGDSTDRLYKGVIYSGSDESILYKGNFDYSKHTQLDYKNSNIYSRWDGDRLYLKDNSFLKAINK